MCIGTVEQGKTYGTVASDQCFEDCGIVVLSTLKPPPAAEQIIPCRLHSDLMDLTVSCRVV